MTTSGDRPQKAASLMDVKCCGCKDEASWAEAVLFDAQGRQIACSDVEADLLWSLFSTSFESDHVARA